MSSRFGGGCGGGFEAVFPGPLRRPFYLIYMVPVIRKLADASRNRQELTLGELAPYKFVWDFNTLCTPQWLEIDRELKCITGEGTVSANVLQIYNHASLPQSLLKRSSTPNTPVSRSYSAGRPVKIRGSIMPEAVNLWR